MAKKDPHFIMKNYLPEAPRGVSKQKWLNSQLALKAKGVPNDILYTLKTLRQVNLYTWLVIIMGHPAKWVKDHEETLLDPKFKRAPGQA